MGCINQVGLRQVLERKRNSESTYDTSKNGDTGGDLLLNHNTDESGHHESNPPFNLPSFSRLT